MNAAASFSDGVMMALRQRQRVEDSDPTWGYVIEHPTTGSKIVRCAKHAFVRGWKPTAIPMSVYYAACSCGCVVRSGRVSYKDSMAVATDGCLELTAPPGTCELCNGGGLARSDAGWSVCRSCGGAGVAPEGHSDA